MRRSRPNQAATRTRAGTTFVLLGLVCVLVALALMAGYVWLTRDPLATDEDALRAAAQTLADSTDQEVADLLDAGRYARIRSPGLQYYLWRSNSWYRGRSRRRIELTHRRNAGVYRRRLQGSKPTAELKRLLDSGLLPSAELVLTDSVGRVLAATSRRDQVLCGDEEWWLRAGGDGGVYLALLRDADACSVVVAVPVYDTTGDTLRGVLRLARRLPRTVERIRSFAAGSTGFAALLTPAGGMLVAPERTAHWSGGFNEWIAAPEASVHRGPGWNADTAALVAVGPVPSTSPAGTQRWVVVVEQSLSELTSASNNLGYGIAALVLAACAVVVLVVLGSRSRRSQRRAATAPLEPASGGFSSPPGSEPPPEPEPVPPSPGPETQQAPDSEPVSEPADTFEATPAPEPAGTPEPDSGVVPQEVPGPVPEPAAAPVSEPAPGTEPDIVPEPEPPAEPAVELEPAEETTGKVSPDDTETLKSDLIATIARELRAPLPPIVDLATLLMKNDLSEESRRKFLAIIIEEGRRLMELIDKLSTLSLLESGKHELRLETVDIRMLVGQVVETEARHHPRHRLSSEVPEGLPGVTADPERIRTAIRVLVSNAIMYSPAGGPVVVSCREEHGFVAISVRDHGVGIRNQDLPLLFRRFHRLNREATPNVRGFGLGLSICKGIVEQHGGRVEVDSRYGEGSTFTLVLPVRGPDGDRQVPPAI